MVVAGGIALLTGQPWLFPSLGPTAVLQTEQPTAESSSPRNTVIGHAVALAAGYLALLAFGLTTAGPALSTGVDLPRVGAAAVSLGLTAGVLALLDRPHPPAGATTLIVSLGLLNTPTSLGIALASVCVVTASCWLYNRASGAPMSLWWSLPGGARRSQPRSSSAVARHREDGLPPPASVTWRRPRRRH